jgi:signal transduction histidine kinase
MHDKVTQILSSMSLLTQSIGSAWQRDPAEGQRRVARLAELAQTAFVEMRMLLRELSPPPAEPRPHAPTPPRGSASAVPAAPRAPAVPQISQRSRTVAGLERLREHALPGALERLLAVMVPEDLKVKIESTGYVPQSLEHEEALYRVSQEAASNAIRHAKARVLTVSATVTTDQAVLRIADDGRGLGAEFRPGIGLGSMRARIEAAGGHLRVTPNTPCGTLIEARLPRVDRKR